MIYYKSLAVLSLICGVAVFSTFGEVPSSQNSNSNLGRYTNSFILTMKGYELTCSYQSPMIKGSKLRVLTKLKKIDPNTKFDVGYLYVSLHDMKDQILSSNYNIADVMQHPAVSKSESGEESVELNTDMDSITPDEEYSLSIYRGSMGILIPNADERMIIRLPIKIIGGQD